MTPDPAATHSGPAAITTEPAADRAADLALLRHYEPIVHYTKGELFFPTEVDEYVARSSLWAHRPSTGRNELLVRAGSLSVDNLAKPRTTEFGAVEFLRRVEDVDLATQARALLAGSAQDLPESRAVPSRSWPPGTSRLRLPPDRRHLHAQPARPGSYAGGRRGGLGARVPRGPRRG